MMNELKHQREAWKRSKFSVSLKPTIESCALWVETCDPMSFGHASELGCGLIQREVPRSHYKIAMQACQR
jgi:hypothetical protein